MSDSLELRGFFEGFKRNPFASVLLKGLSCFQRAAGSLRDCDATEVEVSALVRDVVVVEFDDFVGLPVTLTPRVGVGADNDLKCATCS